MGTSLIGIIAIICAIYVIYDVWSNQKGMSDGNKLLWTILALFFSIITAILYLLMVKRR
ncbi:PLDc N-terminal domain-containing protein [Marinoscillum furvescens]|uniref:Phospholipase D-like protein n=1 Tax=Marinoscillum furvescens DSM 4134 TaxID=1122208 RepID=A0A3D9KVT2_MARFU|nr:PLDc N-terminal domain-containing protein [Marinoscillum furvescens]RED91767.1 phospholipase D-like protein [Marinoscillum furvescens DSM 4134]